MEKISTDGVTRVTLFLHLLRVYMPVSIAIEFGEVYSSFREIKNFIRKVCVTSKLLKGADNNFFTNIMDYCFLCRTRKNG